MKKIFKVIILLLICLSLKTVYAENYKIKELIPYNVDTTIHTDNFSYIGMYFNDKGIYFNNIKNVSDQKLPISISVGLFDRKGLNIGTINYCDSELDSKVSKDYFIEFSDKYLGNKKTVKDIKYIAVLSDNINCRTGGSKDYIGQSVDKLGIGHGNEIDDKTELFLSIVTVVAGALIILFVYKLVFTRAYRNVDGEEVRDAFDGINKELAKKREEYERTKPAPPPKEPNKPIEILEQEEKAKKEDKTATDLHNLYK